MRVVRALLPVVAAAALPAPGSAVAASLTWSAPTPADTGGSSSPSSIACASSALCVAVDRSGKVFAATDPSAAGSWKQVATDSSHALVSVTCAVFQLCVAVDDAGRALVSQSPATSGSWHVYTIDGTTALSAVSCPAGSLCVAVDQAGQALASAEPAAGKPWTAMPIDGGHALEAVSCASVGLCVAVDDAGAALVSKEPGVSGAWRRRTIDPTPTLDATSCDADGACVALDESGTALASGDPASSAPTWSATTIDLVALTSVSCAAFDVCVAVDRAGNALVSEDAPAAAPSWVSAPADPSGRALASVSCAVDGFCAAIDSLGEVLTTTVPAPPQPAPPPPPSLVTPRPVISGVPAVGSRLFCDPGVPAGEPATLAYAWGRDGAPIPGAGASSYRVASADATHHLQCLVTATDAAGSVTGHSAFVAIPAQGVLAAVNETSVGRARWKGGRVQVAVLCSPRAAGACVIALRITIRQAAHRRRVTITLGAGSARLSPGRRGVLSVALSAAGRHLLARSKRLVVQLSVSGTVIGVLKAALSTQRLTLSASAHGARSRFTARLASASTAAAPARLVSSALTPARLASAGTGTSASASTAAATSAPAVLSPTPYMGWDTYFALGPRFSESTVLEQASTLLSNGLAHDGYRLVWLDAGWWQGERDAHGQIEVDRSQWPHGMAWLTSTLHAAGLLAGLYTDAGIEGCGGRHQGSYYHYRQDADTFAAWGFDAVKVDFCGGVRQRLDPAAAYSSFHAAMQANSSHRPMLLSICDFLEPGQFQGGPPFAQSAFSSYSFGPRVGNSWRTDTDVGSPGHVTFATVLRNLDADAAHPEAARPGHWNDPDYLGPDQGMSGSQFRTQLSMWAMLAAPLMVSADLRRISPASRAALENREAIAIDQDPAGVQGTLLGSDGEGEVWARTLHDGSRAVALLNRGPVPMWIETTAASVGMPAAGSYLVRDVWAGRSYRTSESLGAQVEAGSTVLLRISAVGS